jgi:hypothetical protein
MSANKSDGVSADGTSSNPVALALQAFVRQAEGILEAVVASTSVYDNEGFVVPDEESQLRELRAAMPRRPLRLDEGLRIAERQAGLLRWQLGRAGAAALPTDAVVGLSFLTVTTRRGIGKSGAATKTARGWVIVLNADEPLVRQRFSLCHELKHVLDDPFSERRENGLYPGSGGVSSDDLAERVCDHFAGVLLMPKILVRRDWANRMQDPAQLARRYNVSRAAMEVRLRQLGLTEVAPRCGKVVRLGGA